MIAPTVKTSESAVASLMKAQHHVIYAQLGNISPIMGPLFVALVRQEPIKAMQGLLPVAHVLLVHTVESDKHRVICVHLERTKAVQVNPFVFSVLLEPTAAAGRLHAQTYLNLQLNQS